MTRTKVPVREFMSRLPVEILDTETVHRARECMRAHGVRHLPVFHGAKLRGIVSLQDVQELLAEHGEEAGQRMLAELCDREPRTVPSTASLPEAAATMARHEIGSVLVVEADILVGILTAQDVVRYAAGFAGPERSVARKGS